MEEALKVGRVFLHEIPESRLPQWSMDVWEAVMLAMEEEEADGWTPDPAAHSQKRLRGGRRAKNRNKRAQAGH